MGNTLVRFAAVRLVVATAMNAVILKLHEDIAEKLLNLHDIEGDFSPDRRQYAYTDHTYEIYGSQVLSIIHGNIWSVVFEAFLMFLCLSLVCVYLIIYNLDLSLF